jgi:hypothetical protein
VTDLATAILAKLTKWKAVCGALGRSTGSLSHALRVPVAAIGAALARLRASGKVALVSRVDHVGPRRAAECCWSLT